MVVINIDNEVYRAIETAAHGGDLNQSLRRLLGLPPASSPTEPAPVGEFAALIAAELIAPGDHLSPPHRSST